MTNDQIRDQIRRFLATTFPAAGVELTDETDLLEEWFVDSLGIVQTVMFLEQTFGIQLGRADIDAVNFRTVATLAALVEARLAG